MAARRWVHYARTVCACPQVLTCQFGTLGQPSPPQCKPRTDKQLDGPSLHYILKCIRIACIRSPTRSTVADPETTSRSTPSCGPRTATARHLRRPPGPCPVPARCPTNRRAPRSTTRFHRPETSGLSTATRSPWTWTGECPPTFLPALQCNILGAASLQPSFQLPLPLSLPLPCGAESHAWVSWMESTLAALSKSAADHTALPQVGQPRQPRRRVGPANERRQPHVWWQPPLWRQPNRRQPRLVHAARVAARRQRRAPHYAAQGLGHCWGEESATLACECPLVFSESACCGLRLFCP